MTADEARAVTRARAAARERPAAGRRGAVSDDVVASPIERMLEQSLLAARGSDDDLVAAALEQLVEEPPPAAEALAAETRPNERWRHQYAIWTIAADAVLLLAAALLAYFVRFGTSGASVGGHFPYFVCALVAVPTWLLFLAAGRCYEHRFFGVGAEELRRVSSASVRFVAAVALLGLATQTQISRAYVLVGLLLGVALLLAERAVAHRLLRRMRSRGRCVTRVVAVGDRKRIAELVEQAHREPEAGFVVVGACTTLADVGGVVPGTDVPILGGVTGVVDAVRRVGADTVAVTASSAINAKTMRRLGWDLEGTGVSLVVAPGLTDVAGPRIQVRPLGGRMPLLEVDEPEFTGARKVFKDLQDRLLAAVLLVALSPVLLAIAILVRLDSRGPALFRQIRVGRCGEPFTVYKFRSMTVDAEDRLRTVVDLNEGQGLLFKLREDPRVTRVGRWLRRFSLDELPQLVNVVRGDMALVGPRPPLPQEVERYGADVRRRLLVKPGVTGLWQVGGRSDLSWDDSVRLDLYYVENWSLALDLSILAKTVAAVVKGRGAY